MAASKHEAHSGSHGCCGGHAETGGGTPAGAVLDPVCGMTVDPDRTAHHATHAGHDHHFCSAGCRTKFVADPERYLNKSAAPAAGVPPGSVWTWAREGPRLDSQS